MADKSTIDDVLPIPTRLPGRVGLRASFHSICY